MITRDDPTSGVQGPGIKCQVPGSFMLCRRADLSISRAHQLGTCARSAEANVYFPNCLSKKPAMMPSASFDSGNDGLFQKACDKPSKTTSRPSTPPAKNLR